MRLKSYFEIVDIANEFVVIPIGEKAKDYGGIVTLSETAAFLLKKLKTSKSVEELAILLFNEYDIDERKAQDETNKAIAIFNELDLLEE